MPSSELVGWINFYQAKSKDKKRQEEVSKGNLLAMDESELAATFGKGR